MYVHKKLFANDSHQTNPYIAFTDVVLNLLMIILFVLAFLLAMGRPGWEEGRYREPMQELQQAIAQLSSHMRPTLVSNTLRNDPPGVQRWMFSGKKLFYPKTSRLTPEGYRSVQEFAQILNQHRDKWRRIRIEGHTIPPRPGQRDDWELSAKRAAVVARIFYVEGKIEPYFLAVAGRAGQTPIDKANPENPANERVEIAIEFIASSNNRNDRAISWK